MNNMKKKIWIAVIVMVVGLFLATNSHACNDPKNPKCPNFDINLVNWQNTEIWNNPDFYNNVQIRNDPRFCNSPNFYNNPTFYNNPEFTNNPQFEDYFNAEFNPSFAPNNTFSPTVTNTATATANNYLTIEDLREIVSTVFQFANLPSQEAPETGAPRFRSVEEMVRYQGNFCYDQIMAMYNALPAKYKRKNFFSSNGMDFLPCSAVLPKYTEAASHKNRLIHVVFQEERPAEFANHYVQTTAYLQSDGEKKIHSLALFILALKMTWENEGNVLALGTEGTVSITRSFGASIGASYTKGSISKDQRSSEAGSGGTGLSYGSVWSDKNPFAQYQSLHIAKYVELAKTLKWGVVVTRSSE